MERRDFLKKVGIGVGATAATAATSLAGSETKEKIIEVERKIDYFDKWIKEIVMRTQDSEDSHFTISRCMGSIHVDVHASGKKTTHRVEKTDIPNECASFVDYIETRKGKDLFLKMVKNGGIKSAKDIPNFIAKCSDPQIDSSKTIYIENSAYQKKIEEAGKEIIDKKDIIEHIKEIATKIEIES